MAKAVSEIVTPVKLRKFIARFQDLWHQRTKVDFEIAGLAAEVRDTYPKGASGDYQFRRALTDHLHVHTSTARMLADAGRAFRLFPKEEEWHLVSGWEGIRFLCGLGKADRRKVYRAAKSKSTEIGRPIGYQTVRELGFRLGAITKRRGGRATYSINEAHLGCLRLHLQELYADYELPEMPPAVSAAMLAPKAKRQ